MPVKSGLPPRNSNLFPRRSAGRSVTLVLDNSQAETEHGIKLPTFGFYRIARGGQVTRKTFIFDKPGEYDFMCDLPGHQEAGMKGKLIVGGP